MAEALLLVLFLLISPVSAHSEEAPDQEALQRRQKVELLGFFEKDPNEAKMPGTQVAIQLYNEAVQYFQKNEYDLARQALQNSIAYDETNAYAYELLGDVDYYQQRLSEAKANYEIAYNLKASDSIKQKIERLRNETTVEKKLSTYREEHFIIKYHNEEKTDGFALRELLRNVYRDVSKDFAYYFKHQVVVLLYDEEEFKKISNAPHWAAGLYDGKVRMPLNKRGFTDLDLRALTTHEVTHAFVAAMSGGRAPAWINEGLAEFEEDKVRKDDLTVFNSAVKTNTLMSLDQLMAQDATASISDPLLVALFYQQSYQVIRYMVGRYGMFRIKQVLGEFGKGKNSDESLRSILHISPARLEKEWKASFGR